VAIDSPRAYADDCLPAASRGRVKRTNGIIEARDVTDVCPQPSVPHSLHDLTQFGTIGLDDEVHRQAVSGPRQCRVARSVLELLAADGHDEGQVRRP
jgi:hypothetical protein